MKKAAIAILLAIATGSCSAQARPEFHLVPFAAAGITGVSNNDYPGTDARKDKRFLSAGLSIGYSISKHWGLYAGLAVSSFQWRSMVGGFPNAGNRLADIHQQMLQVPVNLQYKSSKPGKVGVLAIVGSRFSFLLHEKETDAANSAVTIAGDDSWYHHTGLAVDIGAGATIPCSKKVSLNLLLIGQTFLTYIYKPGAPDERLSATALSVGLDIAL